MLLSSLQACGTGGVENTGMVWMTIVRSCMSDRYTVTKIWYRQNVVSPLALCGFPLIVHETDNEELSIHYSISDSGMDDCSLSLLADIVQLYLH